ncbi:MAG TPA: 4-(cytidine 5'-diphospho)-2-C-methyl-D-erythritol kinase [Candidatus Dormibacteraeota bacterium]|nr:4-(cytidine 5'-diphospho)-2-C-methyl-D-erythritol kinase [Candidatus Dormibacteraeota bacterium]
MSAPAKLNLCLRIVGRRADGYHLLDSAVAPIALFDVVRIHVEPQSAAEVSIHCMPRGTAPNGPENLAARAALVYLQRTGWSAKVRIDLDKRIPAGAGLGGGSSDAAATLRLLNALSDDPVPASELSTWALDLGADVPFFLSGGSARMRGVGDRLDPMPVPLDPRAGLVVVFPGTPLETRHVYANYDDLLTTEGSVSRVRGLTVDRGPLHEWLENDLEAAAFQILPIVKNLKRQLRALGARGALMTGSGSAVFGVWDGAEQASAAARAMRAAGLWARATWILDRLPAVETHDADDGRSPSW